MSSRRRFLGLAMTGVLFVLVVPRAIESLADGRQPNVLRNGSFERSLGGWQGFNATLARVPRAAVGKRAARVTVRAGATDYSIYPDPRPVASTKAGTVYTAQAWIRSARPRVRVCLRVREWSGESEAGSAQACRVPRRAWRRLGPLPYRVADSGRAVDVYLYQQNAKAGDRFDVDGIVLRRRSPPAGQSPPGGDPVLLAAGDIASCGSPGDEATAKLLDRLPGTIAALGDTAYESGTAEDFAQCYQPSWGRHKSRTRPAVGNHEYETAGAAPYFDYFGTAAGPRGKGYYSYDLGTWHLVVLNSNCGRVGGCGAGSPQERWLRGDLAEHKARCTLAYWHHPRFSSGWHGSDRSYQAFWQTLYDYDADVVLVGHDHDYERFAPQTPSGVHDSGRGIREFVVGTGGGSYRAFPPAIAANSEIRKDGTFGILRVVLGPGSYSWKFIPEAGKTFTDSGTAACH